jgi:hypothetical protein
MGRPTKLGWLRARQCSGTSHSILLAIKYVTSHLDVLIESVGRPTRYTRVAKSPGV